MDDQNKNLLLATGLSFAVMLVWFAIAPPHSPPPTVEEVTDTSPIAGTSGGSDVSTNILSSNAKAVADADRIKINTPRLEGSLSLLAGRIDDLRLKDYTESIDEGSPIVTLPCRICWPPGAGIWDGWRVVTCSSLLGAAGAVCLLAGRR